MDPERNLYIIYFSISPTQRSTLIDEAWVKHSEKNNCFRRYNIKKI